MNQYEQAIMNVGQIVEPYDKDGRFPVFGFGGVPRHIAGVPQGVSHCFAMNGNPADPTIPGVMNILQMYKQTLP